MIMNEPSVTHSGLLGLPDHDAIVAMCTYSTWGLLDNLKWAESPPPHVE